VTGGKRQTYVKLETSGTKGVSCDWVRSKIMFLYKPLILFFSKREIGGFWEPSSLYPQNLYHSQTMFYYIRLFFRFVGIRFCIFHVSEQPLHLIILWSFLLSETRCCRYAYVFPERWQQHISIVLWSLRTVLFSIVLSFSTHGEY
jgi:hypothetical protein